MSKTVRVPISVGFSISFSIDGRALSQGKTVEVAIDFLESWMPTHVDDVKYALVEEWIRQAQKQIEEDRQLQKTRKKREEINASVDKALRENPEKLGKELSDIARRTTLEAHGILPEDDE
ncbi:MAG TPA: hypothetical protein VN442_01140 [Bryobacteraceae bacterium]|nr:hypothetical protein [Bryobacteraceae bacterium]